MRGERAEGKGEKEREKKREGGTREHYGKTALAFLKEKDVGNGNLESPRLEGVLRRRIWRQGRGPAEPSLALECCTVLAL